MTNAIIIGERRRPAVPKGTARGADQIARHIAANFYPTPPEATRALLSVERFDAPIWEPACGKGHIARVLEDAGHQVLATDLNDWCYGACNVDFLDDRHVKAAREAAPRIRHIVTNPPYGSGLADGFIRQALAVTADTGGKVAMLLNLASLAHADRTPFWRAHPPARIHAIDSVVCWPDPDRAPPRHFIQHRYCWVVWSPDHRGPTEMHWLSARDFRVP